MYDPLSGVLPFVWMKQQDKTFTARISKTDHEMLRQLAVHQGRSRGDVVRNAIAIHYMEATLAYLQSPEAEAELGDELADAQRKVKADLAKAVREAFQRPQIEPLGSALN